MIDIHTHILPNMDDGSASPEETAELLAMELAQGVDTVALTPHFYGHQEDPESFLTRRAEAVDSLLQTEEMPRLLLGAEVAYFSGIGISEAVPALQLGNSGLLLIEMPFDTWSDRVVKEICDLPETLGLTPVLAHVERYRKRNQFLKYYRQLAEKDVLFQLNAQAFTARATRGWALKLIKNGYVQFLGSDCHNATTRPPNVQLAGQFLSQKLGPAFVKEFNEKAHYLLFPDETKEA